jgi:hypothetical protein
MISIFDYETGAMRLVFAITNEITGRPLWEAMIFNSSVPHLTKQSFPH